jgi:cell division protease FtsH
LDRISDYLYEKETITGKEFMKMFREMKGIDEDGNPVSADAEEEAADTSAADTEQGSSDDMFAE